MSQYNDTWYALLGGLGYTGAFNDRMLAYALDRLAGLAWILEAGVWDDTGVWRDSSVWRDS